jgi:L-fuculose-phosphate aldolase
MGKWDNCKMEVWQGAQEMLRLGLVSGSGGNVSARLPLDGELQPIAITPSRLPYNQMKPGDIIIVDSDGDTIEGDLPPSSETLMHLAIYRNRADVHGIMHTHSIFASVVAIAGLDIPPLIDEMVLFVGGSVRVAEYGFPGTEDLAEKVAAALGDRQAALVRNHGMVGVGSSVSEALNVCVLVERLAQMFIYAQSINKAIPLPDEAARAEQELFQMQRQANQERKG